MTTLDTINGLLHDEKHDTLRHKTVNMIAVVIACGSWSAAGYILAMRDNATKLEAVQLRYASQMADESDKFRKELDNLRLTCIKKDINK